MMEWLNKFIERGKYIPPQALTNGGSILANFMYWVCMFAGIGGILFYICGSKKGGKIAKYSLVIYWVVAALCCKN